MVHIRRFSACTLAYTHTYMYSRCTSTGPFLHSPGHDCIRKSVRSVQYCMADTIASDTGRPLVWQSVYNFALVRSFFWAVFLQPALISQWAGQNLRETDFLGLRHRHLVFIQENFPFPTATFSVITKSIFTKVIAFFRVKKWVGYGKFST